MTVEEIKISRWRCLDDHRHLTKLAAEQCNDGRPKRLKLKAAKAAVRRAEAKIVRERAKRHKQELARMDELEAACRQAEIGSTGLDERIAFSLYCSGVDSRDRFREEYVTAENTLNLIKLQQFVDAHDYPKILSWLNA